MRKTLSTILQPLSWPEFELETSHTRRKSAIYFTVMFSAKPLLAAFYIRPGRQTSGGKTLRGNVSNIHAFIHPGERTVATLLHEKDATSAFCWRWKEMVLYGKSIRCTCGSFSSVLRFLENSIMLHKHKSKDLLLVISHSR